MNVVPQVIPQAKRTPLRMYRHLLRSIKTVFKGDMEVQTNARMEARSKFLGHKYEKNKSKIEEYMTELESIIYVLDNEVMQVSVSETDQNGNPTKMQAHIRPQLLRDPPTMCTVPLNHE